MAQRRPPEGPHAHQVVFLPQENALCCVDLGADALFTYAQDKDTGWLSLRDRFTLRRVMGRATWRRGRATCSIWRTSWKAP